MAERKNPAWAVPCTRFIEYLIQAHELVHLAQHGISFLKAAPIAIEALMPDGDDPERDTEEKRLRAAKEEAQLAQSEIDNDFPLLLGHAIMGLWGALEAMIEDLAISWMQHNPSVLDEPRIAKIRIPLIEFQKMSDQDRLRFLVTELQRDLGLEFKSGATKFETLLGLLSLGGPVDKRVRDVIFETQNIRNVLAHRAGIADRRFVANCPHLQYSIGDTVKVGSEHFEKIWNGLLTYSFIILNRCRAIDGLSLLTKEPRGFEGALSIADDGNEA